MFLKKDKELMDLRASFENYDRCFIVSEHKRIDLTVDEANAVAYVWCYDDRINCGAEPVLVFTFWDTLVYLENITNWHGDLDVEALLMYVEREEVA